MIDLSQSTLAYLLGYSFLLGISLGVIYDAFRFMKQLLGVPYGKDAATEQKRGKLLRALQFSVTFVFDVVFWLLFAASSLLLTYNVSGGVFRGMVYTGMTAGLSAYYFTLGRLVLMLSGKVARFLRRAVAWTVRKLKRIIKAIIYPIIKLYHLTFGKVIGKIKAERKARRVRRLAEQNANASELPSSIKEEEKTDVTKYRYEREGRISFSGHRGE